jgi:hypothetical protein
VEAKDELAQLRFAVVRQAHYWVEEYLTALCRIVLSLSKDGTRIESCD